MEFTKTEYKMDEVAVMIMTKWPKRWMNIESAKASINLALRDEQIKKWGRGKNRSITPSDLQTVLTYLEIHAKKSIYYQTSTPLEEISNREEIKTPSTKRTTITAVTESLDPLSRFYMMNSKINKQLETHLSFAQSPEERIAIYDYFASVYRGVFSRSSAEEPSEGEFEL